MAMPNFNMQAPGQPFRPQAAAPYAPQAPLAARPPQAPQATQWKVIGAAQPPAVVRGVAADAPANAPPAFALPPPEALGVSTSLNLPQGSAAVPTAAHAPPAPVDWNQIQARMERLRVVGYQKESIATGGMKVTLLVQTDHPTQRQPIQAHGASEAAAILMALQTGEAWAQQQRGR